MNQYLRLAFHVTHFEKYCGANDSEIPMANRREVEDTSEGKAILERILIKIVLKELLIGTPKLNLS